MAFRNELLIRQSYKFVGSILLYESWNCLRNLFYLYKYLWINRIKWSLIFEFIKLYKLLIHLNVRLLLISKKLSSVHWLFKCKRFIRIQMLDMINEPTKLLNIFLKHIKTSLRNLHFFEYLVWFFCVLILHLASYKSWNY